MTKSSKKNSWQVLADELAAEILAGKYAGDVAMPGEYPLCERFECSRTTVRRAMVELEKRGLVYRRHGKGTFAHPVQTMAMLPVGLLIKCPEKLTSDYFVELVRGCNSYVNSLGSNLSIFSTNPADWSEKQFASIAGLIVIPAGVTPEDIAALEEHSCSYVIMMESDLPGPTVNMEPEQAAYELTIQLLQKGHRSIGLLSGHFEHADLQKRRGITRALAEFDLSIEELPDFPTDYDTARALNAAEALLAQTPRVTAVIAFDDALAMQVMSVANRLGISMPSQLSVVGFNNSAFGSLATPALTTVHFPAYEAGRAAARMIATQHLKGTEIKSIVQHPHLVLRESIAEAPTERSSK